MQERNERFVGGQNKWLVSFEADRSGTGQDSVLGAQRYWMIRETAAVAIEPGDYGDM
jgi:hypothetical protein